ncbi:hypothetical protein PoB_002457000 [Plakobranchus ocellatus]|uniref:Uncharacterized protein n=1 Tax=Plakobranchus ocellatus TaxID=259542 RepID=A0AAV3ZTV4_9GAST|nr:hypothetical protein PoB_002457000 [Plakobranchus ocellatus]
MWTLINVFGHGLLHFQLPDMHFCPARHFGVESQHLHPAFTSAKLIRCCFKVWRQWWHSGYSPHSEIYSRWLKMGPGKDALAR